MSPYSLYCSVCEDNFSRSDDWTKHLFGNDHQNKARLECVQWQDTRKECALVAFFSCPITSVVSKENQLINNKCDEDEGNLLIQLRNYLVMNLNSEQVMCSGSFLVTDFVWWSEQPKMGILQFESREKATQVYDKLIRDPTGVQKQHKIGKHLVQLKKLVDLLELEWRMLLPNRNHDSQKCSRSTSKDTSPCRKKGRIDGVLLSKNTPKQNIVPVMEISNSSGTSNLLDLSAQYNDIIKSVQIPSHIINQAEEITQTIDAILRKKIPNCEVHLLRSHHLKIKTRLYNDQNDILIFVHGGHKSTKGSRKLKVDQVNKLLTKSGSIPDLKLSAAKAITKELDLDNRAGQRFELQTNNLSTSGFHLFTDLSFVIEAQLNRLLSYMCQFDPRCYPVLSLIHYFCTTNSCYFDDPQLPENPMEWLFILFMSKKKFIPTVRQILAQPHDPIWQTSDKRKINVGFNDNNQKYLLQWQKSRTTTKKMEDYSEPIGVLKLFKEFLEFIGNVLGRDHLILNVRDGEILDRNSVFNRAYGVSFKTKLTEEEISVMANSPGHRGKLGKRPFSIVHPLVVNLKLAFQVENMGVAVKLMRFGGKELDKFLVDIGKGIEITNGKLESILKIEGPIRRLILTEKLAWQGKTRMNH